MKTFGKIMVCIIVIALAVGTAYWLSNGKETNNNELTNSNTSSNSNNTTNNKQENETTSDTTSETTEENTDYVGEEENKEEPENKNDETENNEQEQEETTELTGKDKAIDIVKKQYALEGQTVRFHHMEGADYIIKINDGTAVTWYLVDGTTWEAEEY